MELQKRESSRWRTNTEQGHRKGNKICWRTSSMLGLKVKVRIEESLKGEGGK